MWTSPIAWIGVAVFIFWALGAHNRLIRLRRAVIQTYSPLDASLIGLLAFLDDYVANAVEAGGSSGALNLHTALQGAVAQLRACATEARAHPARVECMAALGAAKGVLQAAWTSIVAEGGWDGASEPVPQQLTYWNEHTAAIEKAAVLFNGAVSAYNAAIVQFPAVLMAHVLRYRPAQGF